MRKILILLLVTMFSISMSGCTEEEKPTCNADQELVGEECVDIEVDCEAEPNHEDCEEEVLNCRPGYHQEGNQCVEDVVVYNGSKVILVGKQLYVDDELFLIKGVCWNPVPIGGSHPNNIQFLENVEADADLMQAAGINVVRTYEPIINTEVLDVLYEHGIYVINTVYSSGANSASSVANAINQTKDHKAILFWAIGNEWNYNGLYNDMSISESIDRINDVAAVIKNLDENHPISTIYGNLPSVSIIEQMPDIDIWGINAYSGATFGSLFTDWLARTDKPMFMAEYGADAYNDDIDSVDEESQAYAVRTLTQVIINYSSINNYQYPALGGTVFEWNDEWWKAGDPDTHDTGGSAPGFGPYPDFVFNEEYWGIVDINRNPREAYYELQEIYTNN